MNRPGGLVGTALDLVQDRFGLVVVDADEYALNEAAFDELRHTKRELDLLGYTVLDYLGGFPQEMKPEERRSMAQKCRTVWMNDPQAGASVDLLLDFVLGQGIPKPNAKDEGVQKVIDDAWTDAENEAVITRTSSQRAFLTDLFIQSNVFPLCFDDGEDGKVKLGLLQHDTVEHAVRHTDNRLLVTYYMTKEKKQRWNFKEDRLDLDHGTQVQAKTLYYEHWHNVEYLTEEEIEFDKPPDAKRGDGKVYHIAVNRGMEQVFGVPTMQRTIRWFSAFNSYMRSRVDLMEAAAALMMRRKIKGGPREVQRLAQQAMRSASTILPGFEEAPERQPPRSGSIITENENVQHEQIKMDTMAGNAMQDGSMLRAQVSAGHRFPQSYYGDASNSNLATATSLELPVLKYVEFWQEIVEDFIRWFTDRVIERAVEVGKIKEELEGEELVGVLEARGWRWFEDEETGESRLMEAREVTIIDQHGRPLAEMYRAVGSMFMREGARRLVEAHEDKPEDEVTTQRDLGYEFKMPSPLRRMMPEIVQAVATTARTFDPNNTNLELSRTLLAVVLLDAFEMEEVKEIVDRIFPKGYVDPLMAQAQQMGAAPPGEEGMEDDGTGTGPFGPGGLQTPSGQGAGANAYGAPMNSTPPEKVRYPQEAVVLRDRWGHEHMWMLQEQSAGGTFGEIDERLRSRVHGRLAGLDQVFDGFVKPVVVEKLAITAGTNGAKNGKPH